MFKSLFIIALTLLSVSAREGFLSEKVFRFDGISGSLRNNTNLTDYFLIFDGFATSVGLYSEMPSVASCKVQDSSVIQDTLNIIEDIINGDTATIVDELKGLVDSLYNVYKNCDFAGFKVQFLQTLADIRANFSQPDYAKKLMSQLQSNIFQIMADLKTTIDNFNTNNYENFGKGLGSLVRTVFVVKQ